LSPDPRARLTGTLFGAVALGSTSLYAAFTVAPLVAAELTGSDAWSGVPGACGIVGTALASFVLSRVMARHGRRPGLLLGWVVGVAGALTAVAGIAGNAFGLALAGMFLIGVGHASNQLSRFAAADMHPAERRAFVLGWVVWAATIGAALGPGLLRVVAPLAEGLGLPPLASGFLVALLFYVAALATAATLSPDPSDLGRDAARVGEGERGTRGPRLPTVRLALGALAAAQVAMTLVMTMTPLHLRDAGHGLGAVGAVMSAHFIGMFAFAPAMGRVTDRIGHAPTILVGSALLLVASGVAAIAPGSSGGALGVALFVLGLGWSCAFVAGSALLTQGLTYAARTRVQGGVDAVVWSLSALGSLASGVIVESVGFAWLCAVGSAIAVVPAVAAVGAQRRREAPAAT
jgi:MFS family permease